MCVASYYRNSYDKGLIRLGLITQIEKFPVIHIYECFHFHGVIVILFQIRRLASLHLISRKNNILLIRMHSS